MVRDHVTTLERLLAIEPTNLGDALDTATLLIAHALDCEKVDAFLIDEGGKILVAGGTSDTPLGRKQKELGLDHLPLANRGRMVEAYETGRVFIDGHVERDEQELIGIREGLRVRSTAAVPFLVNGVRRGLLAAASLKPEHFTNADVDFLHAASRWLALLAHHAELTEKIASDAVEKGRRLGAEELVTVLAHDLRNYLTPLAGSIELIQARATRDQRATDLRDVARAKRSLERIKKMTNALLDVARIDQGLFVLSPAPFDLVALARDIAADLGTADHEIQVKAPEELVVTADPERIRQIIENLISNALRHSPKGSPIALEVRHEARNGSCWAIICVADHGPGVPAELHATVFERHIAGKGSKGLGLGLYLANQLAVAHHGRLKLDLEHKPGARFELELPIEDD